MSEPLQPLEPSPLEDVPRAHLPRMYVRAGGPSRRLLVSDDLGEEVYLRIDPDGTLVIARWLLGELTRLILEHLGQEEASARKEREHER